MRAIELYVSDSTLGPLQRYDYSVVANTIDAGDILYSEFLFLCRLDISTRQAAVTALMMRATD